MKSHPSLRIYLPLTICVEHSPTNHIVLNTWGQYGTHMGPVGPRWAPCWPHEPCYASPEGVVFFFGSVCASVFNAWGAVVFTDINSTIFNGVFWSMGGYMRLVIARIRKLVFLCVVYVCVFCVCSTVTIQVLPGFTFTLCALSSLALLTVGNRSRFSVADTILDNM